eukprot:TRINITY_DN64773_c0_g1_i1.p1 TRINITY_DN64773_c0_g1~~TRINITY_DN64773_c0_g1_i1.p1  ORF type:complete len:210 (+),score=19.27 TRINITY_DN64773_c0_g1_i1:62-631(+)
MGAACVQCLGGSPEDQLPPCEELSDAQSRYAPSKASVLRRASYDHFSHNGERRQRRYSERARRQHYVRFAGDDDEAASEPMPEPASDEVADPGDYKNASRVGALEHGWLCPQEDARDIGVFSHSSAKSESFGVGDSQVQTGGTFLQTARSRLSFAKSPARAAALEGMRVSNQLSRSSTGSVDFTPTRSQ